MQTEVMATGNALHNIEMFKGRGGQMVRTQVNAIREAGRNTQGVKLINLDENDRLQAIAPVISEKVETEDDAPLPPDAPAA